MLKVLLVDDEPNVRQGVRMMIPWEELDLEVIGEGEDGDDGLEKIMALSPDIVIADVKMPGMTGIKMIEAAQSRGYEGKCLILSGYSDFSYAKEAMSLGVKQFILKPVDEDELIESLKSVRDEILSHRQDEITMQKGSKYMNEQLLRALLLGDSAAIDSGDLSVYNYPRYSAAIITAVKETDADEKAALLEAVKLRLEREADIEAVTPELGGTTAMLFKGWERKSMISFLTDLSKELWGKIFITAGKTVSSVYDIRESYTEAVSLLKSRFLYLHRGVVTSETVNNMRDGESEINGLIDQIYSYAEINDIDKLNSAIERFQSALCSNGYAAERIKAVCITAVMDIRSRFSKSIGEKKTEPFLGEEFIAKISEKTSLFDITELLKKTLTELSCTYFGRTTKSNMERVVQYIQSNYSRELRLEMLAGIFGYNSAYLGKVFHRYTGENFNNYLDRIRITEAKRLLAMDEYKVYEVAEMVGYTNINYFHNKFKKYVGISPLNYKRRCTGENSAEETDETEEE